MGIFGVIIAFCLILFYIGSVLWAYDDARSRGKSGCLVALLVLLVSWPLGLFLWIIFRPDRR